jgi:hypothetical protein
MPILSELFASAPHLVNFLLGMGSGAGSPLVFIVTNFSAKVQGDTVRTVFLDFSLQRLTNLSFYFGDNNNYPATSQKK